MTTTLTSTVALDEEGERLDTYLASLDEVPQSRSQIKRSIARGDVLLNGAQPSKSGVRLRAGDRVTYRPPAPATTALLPQDIPLTILHEDAHLIVLDKPPGLVVHPAPGHPDGTLVNAILHHCPDLRDGAGGSIRPGIVHRLDKDTSGVMVVCKTPAAHAHLADQFADHSIDRRYLALVSNARHLDERGHFETGHARHPNLRKRFTGRVDSQRRAITHFRIRERFADGSALVACTLETGRTHQIRMHFSEVSSPVLSDALYGTRASETHRIGRHALHAELLGFDHPDPAQGRVSFRALPPADFMDALESLRALTSST